MNAVGRSIIGKIRTINEDSIFVHTEALGCLPNLYVVADGMGGHRAGEIASEMAVAEMKRFLSESTGYTDILDALADAVQAANKKIHNSGNEDSERRGMGTTLIAASVSEGKAHIINVGDSRLYVINKHTDKIEQITVDHSYVMELLRQGKITADEAESHPNKNIITRALGTYPFVECDRFTHKMDDGDMLLICSDGLSNMLSNEDILNICKNGKGLEKTVESLLAGANEKGGIDNISVILYCGNDEE